MNLDYRTVTWPALYIACIVAVNYGFVHVPLVPLFGDMWPPMSLLVGFIFVIRDYTQRAVGHYVWVSMLAGGALSYLMADPFVAIASVTAFLVSEALDWAVYTFTGKTMSQRVLLSSAVSTPFDSIIFLGLIGHLSVVGVLMMVASKMLGAVIVWYLVKRQERLIPVPATAATQYDDYES